MCGLCGIYNFSRNSEIISPEILRKMTDTMIHRGPDDQGVWIDQHKIGLGFRRLSIIDLSPHGHQPMSNEDGSIQLVFNGEIYNHQELRQKYCQNHTYQSNSDTETIIHLYEEKGPEVVKFLEGMFAIALWDAKKQTLLLARDRLGKKPLYYCLKDGALYFASEIKAILAHPQISPDLDEAALNQYLTFATTPAPATLFAGIKKMPAGHFAIFKGGDFKTEEYWDAIVPRNNLSEEEIISQIRELLKDSVKKRMMSDVPFGVFLSGGVDSSTNVALMAQLTKQVRTFSVGFKDQPQMNEFQYARQIAQQFKTEHHEIMIGERELMDYIPSLIHHQDEPIADWVCVPLYYVAKLARDNGVIVVQIGEGSDEIFFGYDGYKIMWDLYYKYWQPYMKSPAWTRGMVYQLSKPWLAARGEYAKLDILRRAAWGGELFQGGAIAWEESAKPGLLTSEYRKKDYPPCDHTIAQILAKIDREKPEADLAERMIYLELKLRLPELLLMRVDKITMSVSVEGRAPYLDQKLVELAMGIPQELKIKGGEPKYLLKKAVEGIIPNHIIYRKKVGFGAPVREWMPSQLGKFIQEGILNSRLRERGIFNYDYIRQILKNEREMKANRSFPIWNLFNLSKWYDYWVAGEK